MAVARRALIALIALVAFAALPACAPAPGPTPVTVFAAASLQGSLDAVAARFTARTGRPVQVSYASTATLARQMLAGAPADVFIAADAAWMDTLVRAGAVDAASRIDVVGNRLVVVAPRNGLRRVTLSPEGLASALGDGRLAVAETDAVPAGRYARQSLMALGLWDGVAGRLAEADDVRGALAFVARGEAPLGIVYATDAKADRRVRVVARLPAESHARITYPAARVASGNADGARAFLAWLRSPESRAQFARAGFVAPARGAAPAPAR